MHNTVSDVRSYFVDQLDRQNFVIDKTGCKMIELVGASFIADEPIIFGKENRDYMERELEWYNSMSLSVNDIPPPVPEIWKSVASTHGLINSNYGYLIYSDANYSQYEHCKHTLRRDKFSRRAIMIYTRPSMQVDYNADGMSDFICTNAVQYLIRDDHLDVVVQMRSNDVVFGYKNDFFFQKHVQEKLADELNVLPGMIYWNAGSLHVYERHFGYVHA